MKITLLLLSVQRCRVWTKMFWMYYIFSEQKNLPGIGNVVVVHCVGTERSHIGHCLMCKTAPFVSYFINFSLKDNYMDATSQLHLITKQVAGQNRLKREAGAHVCSSSFIGGGSSCSFLLHIVCCLCSCVCMCVFVCLLTVLTLWCLQIYHLLTISSLSLSQTSVLIINLLSVRDHLLTTLFFFFRWITK